MCAPKRPAAGKTNRKTAADKGMSGMKEQNNAQLLNFRAIMAVGVGCVIGSGIVAITGSAIGVTGRSVWIAYAAAVILGLVCITPFVILGSVLKLKGGDYSMAFLLLGRRYAGVFIYNFIIMNLALALTAKSIGIYVKSLFPWVNETAVSVIGLTLFFIINLFGIKFMSNLQQVMTVVMLAGFATFCIGGFMNLNGGALDFSQPDYFLDGFKGVRSAMVMLVFSTTTVQTLLCLGGNAKNPKKDIPKAIVCTMGIVFIAYVAIAFVAGNVLPVEEVAFKPLTYVANQVLSKPLFVFFVIGGPIGAICTTLNAMFSVASKPLKQATDDGWFPEGYGRLNRYGEPCWIMLGLYLVALVPLILNLDVATITNNIVLIQYTVKFFLVFAAWKMPKKFPEQWKQSGLHMPAWLFNTIMVIVLLVHVYIVAVAASNLSVTLVGVTVGLLALATAIAVLRDKSGKVKAVIDEEDYI